MLSRKIRRAEEHKARKAARKAGLPDIPAPATADIPSPVEANVPDSDLQAAVAPQETFLDQIPEPGFPLPALVGISPARLAANRENAQLSTGAKSPETKAISAQNHTTHGLARHQNGNFKILTSEDATAFEKLRESLIAEHSPQTPTESILINTMAQSSWLAERAQRLQDMCIDPDTGAITDEKKFSLYMRYQTTHTRAFHKCLNDLLKLRAEKRKADLGFEAQRIESEKHELKKQSHYWDVLKKDAFACRELSNLAAQNCDARRQNPAFDAEYEALLAKHGLQKNAWEAGSAA